MANLGSIGGVVNLLKGKTAVETRCSVYFALHVTTTNTTTEEIGTLYLRV